MLEKIAVACGLANIYLTVRQNIWCWPVGVVMVSLYIYIFFHAKLYSDAGLNVFFLVMQFYGWYEWTRGGVDHSRSLSAVKRLDATGHEAPPNVIQLAQAAARIAGDRGIAEQQLVNEEDAYYYARQRRRFGIVQPFAGP